MKFEIAADMEYGVTGKGTIILNIHALRSPNQAVLFETFSVEPYVRTEELTSAHGENRFIRLDIPKKADLRISYKATVDTSHKITDHRKQKPVPVARLEPSVFPYLYPSRYCQSDKLYRLANNKFGHIRNPYVQVVKLTEWIHRNVEYLSGSTNSQTSAYDTVTEQAGVCRDFAHLGIALCRALSIPARYFTGYSYKLVPQDFHACFEAYLGGDWVLFDATKLAPLNGMVKIATGRDAADTAIANIFGNITGGYIQVSCNAIDGFVPHNYIPSEMKGVSYL
ncbi:transglutaminase-like domain-containing protein [Hufsiella ginkgonis]|uniref:Transglutaminase family protein n=1 Tax=Hufsiella ginkgonis TaxID=2695274 RepID=A0A7K1XXZ7_9SPHI|nr:transglutaminase family protein [Hufsiella ginkgonis]MXV15707.1 transglutaminase family protein [Hufsiella ginkgonis]